MTVKPNNVNKNLKGLFGNVVRIKKVHNKKNHIIWYSGGQTVTIIDTNKHEIVKILNGVIDANGSEPFGFFETFGPDLLLVSTYGNDKKMVYLHDMNLDQRLFNRRCYRDQFFGKLN